MRKDGIGLAGIVLTVMTAGAVRGASFTSVGEFTINSVSPSSTSGYDIFATNANNSGPGTDLVSLPSFLSVDTTGDVRFGPTIGYSQLTVNGTLVMTGVVDQGSSPATLATLTLGSGVPSLFQLGFLEDNTNTALNNTPLTLHSSVLGSTDITINSPPSTATRQNDFYVVNVAGATAGETITVIGTSNGNVATLGGLIVSVPEPASLGGLAAAGLLLSRRRRSV